MSALRGVGGGLVVLCLRLVGPGERHLHDCPGDVVVADRRRCAVNLKLGTDVVGGEHSPLDRVTGPRGDQDEPAHGPCPVPWKGEWPIDARGRDLQDVGRVAQDGGVVQRVGDVATDLRD